MKYHLLCLQTSGRRITSFDKHDYQVSASLMKENERYKRFPFGSLFQAFYSRSDQLVYIANHRQLYIYSVELSNHTLRLDRTELWPTLS